MKEKKVIIIAPIPSAYGRVRLNKLVNQLKKDYDAKVEFWGWNRQNATETKEFDFVDIKFILTGWTGSKLKVGLGYLLWIIKVFINSIIRKEDNLYFCLGFESACPVAFASLFRKKRFIYDNADNISKSYNWPIIIKILLEKLEKFSAKRAYIHLVPGVSRIEGFKDNTRIVSNTPSTEALSLAKEIATNKGYKRDAKLTIYINGYLTMIRGMEIIYKAVRSLGQDIYVIIAGESKCELANKLIELPNVKYLGVVDNAESLAICYKSHVVITLYDPAIRINQLAEPNKWGDCIFTNTPFITNREIITAKPFIENNACFDINYSNEDEFIELLMKMSKNTEIVKPVMKNLDKFKSIYKPWNVAMKEILDDFLQVN